MSVTPAGAESARAARRLLATRDFDRVYRQPTRRQRSPRFLVIARERDGGETRWGISVKGQLGTAVVRNRIKRRLREILRQAEPALPAGWDVVIQPRRADVATADFSELSRELTRLLAAALGSAENV